MRIVIGLVVLVLLMLAIFGCRKIHTSSNTTTTITKDSSTTYKDTSLTVLGSRIEKLLAKGFGDTLEINKVYQYYDSLQRAQLEFVKDSLGNIKAKCICNDYVYNYTYPTKHIHTKENTVREVVREIESKEWPFMAKLTNITLLVIIVLLLLIILFKK